MAVTKRSREIYTDNGKHGHISDFFENHSSRVLCNHSPILNHCDLQRKNILVQEITQPGHRGEEKDFRVSLVDWEVAGWYSSYWEYVHASFCFHMGLQFRLAQ